MTSLLFRRTQSSQSTPPRKCCHGNSKGSPLKLLPFSKFLYIFREDHQIWLNYLSSSLSYGQKTSRVVLNTPWAGDSYLSRYQFHPKPSSPGQTPRTRLEGGKNPSPGQSLCTETLPSVQNRESKAPPPGQ